MEVITYKCPYCGAPIEYDAEKSTFHCEFCGHDVEKSALTPQSAEAEQQEEQGSQPGVKLSEYHCPSCGADLITDEHTAATFCRYCGSPTIVKKNLEGEFKPDYVIPFKVSKEQVEELFKTWCHNGRFTPKGFYEPQQIEKITGTYVPFWLFNCQLNAGISGEAKKVRVWRSGDMEYTNTKNFYVEREADFSFDKVPADASSRMEDELMDALEPYSYKELRQFDFPYLSGFAAEKYDQKAEAVFSRVDSRITQAAEAELRRTITGYTSQMVTKSRKKYREKESNYALLPVWMLRYWYKSKCYTFAVNGQSGKVAGKPPLSILKLCLWGLGITAVAFIVLTLGGALLI